MLTTVSITLENGTTQDVRPAEQLYYDISGRQIAARDANGNLTLTTLLSGTGYDGAQALAAQVIAADGGVTATLYDIHGDARRVRDPLWLPGLPGVHITRHYFDAMGRLLLHAFSGPNALVSGTHLRVSALLQRPACARRNVRPGR